MNILVLPPAWRDLQEIEDWVTEHFGTGYADRTYAKLFKTFRLLAEFPGMGRPRREVTDHYVLFFLVEPYWIVYSTGPTLNIYRVYHAARDLNRLELDME